MTWGDNYSLEDPRDCLDDPEGVWVAPLQKLPAKLDVHSPPVLPHHERDGALEWGSHLCLRNGSEGVTQTAGLPRQTEMT